MWCVAGTTSIIITVDYYKSNLSLACSLFQALFTSLFEIFGSLPILNLTFKCLRLFLFQHLDENNSIHDVLKLIRMQNGAKLIASQLSQIILFSNIVMRNSTSLVMFTDDIKSTEAEKLCMLISIML